MNLLFSNPKIHSGLNVTVRNGKKWLQAQPGDELKLINAKNEDVIELATVVHAVSLPFFSIPPYWLKFEHDPTCRNIQDLKTEMDNVYGSDNWGPEVTVLFFMV